MRNRKLPIADRPEHYFFGNKIPGRILETPPRPVEAVVFILDMSGFTSYVRRYGIKGYIDKIRRMQEIARQVIPRHGGEIVKFVADNAFALFPHGRTAEAAAADFQNTVLAANASLPENEGLKVAIGLARGEVLVMPWRDIFGDAVNIASKLGEDIAGGGEILIDDQIGQEIANMPEYRLERLQIEISGVTLQACRLALP